MTNSDWLPNRFHLRVGGFFGPSYTVDLEGDRLIWAEFRRHGEESDCSENRATFRPSETMWRAFRSGLDVLRIWEWAEEYYPAVPICDGTSWTVQIEFPDGKSIRSEGSNAYPSLIHPVESDWIETEHSLDWEMFCSSVRWMTEGSEFS